MRTRVSFSLAVMISCFPFVLAVTAADDRKPDPLIGKWIWMDRIVVEFQADGSALHAPGIKKGIWKFLDNPEVERKYEVIWEEGIFIDSMKMHRDRNSLEGKNQKGDRVWARRAVTEE